MYSPQAQEERFDSQVKKLNRDLTICKDVQYTLSTPGWKNTIGPILEKMIIEVLGGKIGDVWVSGKIDKARKDERREFHIGYKQFGVDFHTRVNNHLKQIAIIEEQLKQVEKDRNVGYRMPMQETRYNPEGR